MATVAEVSTSCVQCHKVMAQDSHCSRCASVSYCSVACQRAHWPTHKRVCRHLYDAKQASDVAWQAALSEAEGGDASSQNYIGVCFATGDMVAADPVAAARWYTRAAEAGHTVAQCNLGGCYLRGAGVLANRASALKWYTLAAEAGDAEAQFILGFAYEQGSIGIAVDAGAAVRWYTRAAHTGHVDAQRMLGTCLLRGRGVVADPGAAVHWFTKVAQAGDKDAQCSLGFCYMIGTGVTADTDAALVPPGRPKWVRACRGSLRGHGHAHRLRARTFGRQF